MLSKFPQDLSKFPQNFSQNCKTVLQKFTSEDHLGFHHHNEHSPAVVKNLGETYSKFLLENCTADLTQRQNQ